jgi:hypothetical protein
MQLQWIACSLLPILRAAWLGADLGADDREQISTTHRHRSATAFPATRRCAREVPNPDSVQAWFARATKRGDVKAEFIAAA